MTAEVQGRPRTGLRAVAWVAAFVVGTSALLFAAVDEGGPETNADRAYQLANDFACPTCQGQSVAESDAPAARNIRREIGVWVDEGRADEYIRDQLVSVWGEDIDYTPSGTGVTSLVWILPVVGIATAGAGLGLAFRRWQITPEIGSVDRSHPVGERGEGDKQQAVVWMVGIVVVATIAGVLVAQFSGNRSSGESVSGDIRTTSRELLVEAQQALGSGDLEGAIDIYDDVLEIQPSNTEALTYKAWSLRLAGDTEAGVLLIEDAVAIDPEYPEARVFGAVIALDLGDIATAAVHLDAFDALDASPFMEQLVEQQGLRSRIELLLDDEVLERVESILMVDAPPRFPDTGLTVDEVLLAAETLAAGGRVVDALELVQQVVGQIHDDPDLLAGYGWLLARSASPDSPEPAEVALPRLDAALAIDPVHPDALVYRAFTHAFLEQFELAAADLAVFDSLDEQPAELIDLIAAFDLRGQLD